ncbi:MAG: sigma-70 family RNA polymerase sigma factor [Bacteroidota bacterium]
MRQNSSEDYYLQGIRQRDPQVLHTIYQEFFPRIAQAIRQNSGNETEARDIFQDALMVVFQKSRDPEFQLSSSFYTYLYAVARNLWLKKLRKKDRHWVTIDGEMESIADHPPFLAEELRREAQYQLYRRKLQELGEQCRELLKLSLAGTRVSEIVKKMNFSSEGYARKRKFKCKEQLIKLIRKDPEFSRLNFEES